MELVHLPLERWMAKVVMFPLDSEEFGEPISLSWVLKLYVLYIDVCVLSFLDFG